MYLVPQGTTLVEFNITYPKAVMWSGTKREVLTEDWDMENIIRAYDLLYYPNETHFERCFLSPNLTSLDSGHYLELQQDKYTTNCSDLGKLLPLTHTNETSIIHKDLLTI